MHRRSVAVYAAICTGIALATTPDTATAITLFGVESATFRWAPASGSVSYYRVYVSTNGGEPKRYRANGNEAVVNAKFGQTISVSVAAVNNTSGSAVEGPWSLPSEDVLFLDESGPEPNPEPNPDPEPEPNPEPEPEPEPLETRTHYDFDGDGRSDLLIQNVVTGELRVWAMEGTEIIEETTLATGPAVPVVAVGDFDGDETSDVLYFFEAFKTLSFYMNGTATGVIPLDPGWQVASSGDYDGDGRTDLLVRNTGTAEVAIWLLNGSQLIEAVSLFDLDETWQFRTGDFDGDGTDDIVARNTTGLIVMILMENGSSKSTSAVESTDAGWNLVGVGDLDADGRDDLIFRDTGGAVDAWLMDGSEVVASGRLASIKTIWTIVGFFDLDGDRAEDLVLRNTYGIVYAGLVNGLAIFSQGKIAALNGNWIVVSPR